MGGRGTLPLSYCALVIGAISGPTLATIAARPASNRFFSGPRFGCSANERPACGVTGSIGSTPPAAPGAGSAIGSGGVARSRWYSFHDAVSVAITVLWWSLPPKRNTQTSAR